jgi:hypothetical protein
VKCPFCETHGSPPGIKRHMNARHGRAATTTRLAPAPTPTPQLGEVDWSHWAYVPSYGSLDDVAKAATALMDMHGLKTTGPHPWTFRFDAGRTRFGQCRKFHRTITMSEVLTKLNISPDAGNEEKVLATVLHEIAHGIVPPGTTQPHGKEWRAAAVHVGADPRARYDPNTIIMPPEWYARRGRRDKEAAARAILASYTPQPRPSRTTNSAERSPLSN